MRAWFLVVAACVVTEIDTSEMAEPKDPGGAIGSSHPCTWTNPVAKCEPVWKLGVWKDCEATSEEITEWVDQDDECNHAHDGNTTCDLVVGYPGRYSSYKCVKGGDVIIQCEG
jgi:hypothetical protein